MKGKEKRTKEEERTRREVAEHMYSGNSKSASITYLN